MFGFCFVCKCVCVCNGVNYSTRLIYRAVKLIRWNMALVVLTSLLNSPPPPISSPLSALLFVFGPADVRLTRFKCTYSSLPQTITTSYTQIAACSGTKHMRIPRIERHGTESLQNHCIHSICVSVRYYSAPWIIRNVYNIIPVGVYFVLSNCALWTNERCFLEGKSVRLFCAAAISSFEFPLFR